MFLGASRFNRSCTPNAYFTWDECAGSEGDQGRLTVHVNQDIAVDDEIVVIYFFRDCCEPRNTRRTYLQNGPSFDCDCPPCNAQSASATSCEENRNGSGRSSAIKAFIPLHRAKDSYSSQRVENSLSSMNLRTSYTNNEQMRMAG